MYQCYKNNLDLRRYLHLVNDAGTTILILHTI